MPRMFKILIDTCVWLDLAKDPKQTPVLGVVEELVKLGEVSLIVPRIVLDEFRRNRKRISPSWGRSQPTNARTSAGSNLVPESRSISASALSIDHAVL